MTCNGIYYFCYTYKNYFFKVTGGSSGIGKCIAIAAARMGANITIVARNQNRLQVALEEIKSQRLNHNQKLKFLSGIVFSDHIIGQKPSRYHFDYKLTNKCIKNNFQELIKTICYYFIIS